MPRPQTGSLDRLGWIGSATAPVDHIPFPPSVCFRFASYILNTRPA